MHTVEVQLHTKFVLCNTNLFNFLRAKDLTGLNLFDSCLKVLKSRIESEEPEKKVCEYVAHLRVRRFQ